MEIVDCASKSKADFIRNLLQFSEEKKQTSLVLIFNIEWIYCSSVELNELQILNIQFAITKLVTWTRVSIHKQAASK